MLVDAVDYRYCTWFLLAKSVGQIIERLTGLTIKVLVQLAVMDEKEK
jgi:hypothetical protein